MSFISKYFSNLAQDPQIHLWRCLYAPSYPCMYSFLKVVWQEVTSEHLPASLASAATKGFHSSLWPWGGLLSS